MVEEYISRKDAMEYLFRAINADPDGNCPDCIHDEHECQYDRCWTLMDFCEKIEYLGYVPAADVVPVVRCKECQNSYEWANVDGDNYRYCGYLRDRWNHNYDRMVDDDDFCKWGAKMDGEA